ncbi:hypothetical protein JD292_08060 [Leucobacter sp. CSA2]|uniref:Uncharacterized protein n=1 Tax=Leucobacter edaphi TaxID=2796472 RepID=A0A934QDW5_9MICO|nr:hypothetical protein [Leucobacter edaphi]MBK0422026.1 hypothetical protein [Leucobacter edaphi]
MTTMIDGPPLAPDFTGVQAVRGIDGARSELGYRRSRGGHLRDAYPSGTHDLELGFSGAPDPRAVADYTAALLRADERCRRVVLAVPELDLDAISWAEDAGYRYVIDVETVTGGHSLLVTEPQWVIDQPAILEDIPLKE